MISILVISKNLTKAAIFSLTKDILLYSEADFLGVNFTANFGEHCKPLFLTKGRTASKCHH